MANGLVDANETSVMEIARTVVEERGWQHESDGILIYAEALEAKDGIPYEIQISHDEERQFLNIVHAFPYPMDERNFNQDRGTYLRLLAGEASNYLPCGSFNCSNGRVAFTQTIPVSRISEDAIEEHIEQILDQARIGCNKFFPCLKRLFEAPEGEVDFDSVWDEMRFAFELEEGEA